MERVVALVALQLIVTRAAIKHVIALQAEENIVAAEAADVIDERSANQHRMSGIVPVVIVLGSINGEAHCEDFVETERAAVGKRQLLKHRRGVGVVVIEARQIDRITTAEIEQHRPRSQGQSALVETLAEDKNTFFRPGGVVENSIAPVAPVEDIGVLASAADQDVIAAPADQDIIATVPVKFVVAIAAVQYIGTMILRRNIIVTMQLVVSLASDEDVRSPLTIKAIRPRFTEYQVIAAPAPGSVIARAPVERVTFIIERMSFSAHPWKTLVGPVILDRPAEMDLGPVGVPAQTIVAGPADEQVRTASPD